MGLYVDGQIQKGLSYWVAQQQKTYLGWTSPYLLCSHQTPLHIWQLLLAAELSTPERVPPCSGGAPEEASVCVLQVWGFKGSGCALAR